MKKILFLTGTRADFGKLKSLIQAVKEAADFEYRIFATGMHLLSKYGMTVIEIEKCGFKPIHRFENQTSEAAMDMSLAKTIEGFSAYVKKEQPDLIIVHGDRPEALAGAIVGALNNILVGHIEGGEISGTVDEIIRHAVSKMSHLHFVSNPTAAQRLIQLGELEDSIFTIGSADLDILFSSRLPSTKTALSYYDIHFENYAMVLFHPVTTEMENMEQYAENLVDALLETDHNYIVVFPNNDLGSEFIFKAYKRLENNSRFRIFPSLRFEYFISLLKKSKFLIGNSSAGIHEAPYLGIPTLNVGRRQENRDLRTQSIIHCGDSSNEILEGIQKALKLYCEPVQVEENQAVSEKFIAALHSEALWEIDHQKQFKDL